MDDAEVGKNDSSVGGLLDGAEDDSVDIDMSDNGGVGGLLDGVEDDSVDIGENDNGSVGWTIG